MNPELTTHLKDIHGLDAVSWWPPAVGWWLLAVLVTTLTMLLIVLIRNLQQYPVGSWQRDAWRQLRTLKHQSGDMTEAQFAGELSELLRRIAVARHGREQTAALNGQHWLTWLQQHDPAEFDWLHLGQPLITLPYAPPGNVPKDTRQQLLLMVDASFAWTQQRGKQHG